MGDHAPIGLQSNRPGDLAIDWRQSFAAAAYLRYLSSIGVARLAKMINEAFTSRILVAWDEPEVRHWEWHK